MIMPDKEKLSSAMSAVHLPHYNDLPSMGLYLEQTATYINKTLMPLGCGEITGAMIRNYVKMGLVKNPVNKMYYADHICHLIGISILKMVLSLENIRKMFELQEAVYTDEVAYDYLCMELDNVISFKFGASDTVKELGETQSMEKEMLRSAIIAVSNIIYLHICFKFASEKEN